MKSLRVNSARQSIRLFLTAATLLPLVMLGAMLWHQEAAGYVAPIVALVAVTNLLLGYRMAARIEARIAARESELEEARRQASAADQAKALFLTNMSHELRTPLNGIVGMLPVLEDTKLDAEQSSYVEIISQSATALLRLIDEVLEVTELETGAVTLNLRATDLRATLLRVATMMTNAARSKGLRIDLDTGDEPMPLLLCDATRLRQVVGRLVSNAIEFSETGPIKIRLRCHPLDPDHLIARFEVLDHGIGVAPELQEKIFGLFTQGDSSYRRTHGGAGLGLAICKEWIERMDGRIGVLSKPGDGACFWFEVPLQVAPPKQPTPAPPLENVFADNGQNQIAETRILIVDDHSLDRLVLQRLLERMGCHPTAVASGEEALQMLEVETFALILMDCHMPGMDGATTTSAVRRSPGTVANTPIVALTAAATAADHQAALAAGMNDYLTKPVNAEALARVVRKWRQPQNEPQPVG